LGTLNVYFFTTIRLSATITFESLPGFSLTLPTTIDPTGQQFFYAVSTTTPNSGAVLSFGTQGPATVTGHTVNFAPSNNPLTLLAGKSYIVAFYAVSTRATSNIYVASEDSGTVTTYNSDGTQTNPTITAPNAGAVAVDVAGNIYVGSGPPSQVKIYNSSGTLSNTIDTGLFEVLGVAVNAAGNIYAVNRGTEGISSLTGPFPTINFSPLLNGPVGVAVDAAGKIYVTVSNTVATYAPNGAPTTPTITTGLNAPWGVAVDAAGKIYVANSGNNTVTTYTANGVRTTPTITTGLNSPHGVAIDAACKIYVANFGNNTVTTYNSDGTQTAPTITGLNGPLGVAVN
jgi:hypothetical protein